LRPSVVAARGRQKATVFVLFLEKDESVTNRSRAETHLARKLDHVGISGAHPDRVSKVRNRRNLTSDSGIDVVRESANLYDVTAWKKLEEVATRLYLEAIDRDDRSNELGYAITRRRCRRGIIERDPPWVSAYAAGHYDKIQPKRHDHTEQAHLRPR
jgi:hypothetical protein